MIYVQKYGSGKGTEVEVVAQETTVYGMTGKKVALMNTTTKDKYYVSTSVFEKNYERKDNGKK